MPRVRIFPYKMGSQSGKALSAWLSTLRIRQEEAFRPRNGDVIINWGNSTVPEWYSPMKGTIINSFLAVARAANKMTTFSHLPMEIIPDHTTNAEEAQQWVDESHRVYGRQILTGHSGQGIVIFNEGDTVTPCPLYTKNTKAKYEFRVHVMNGQVIDVQQKRKREGFEGGARVAGIRNHVNGWVFCRENLVVPECVKQVGVQAVQALGLDFGAVDVGYVERDNKAYVYEVNTAPGIEGTTLERYVAGFKEHYLD